MESDDRACEMLKGLCILACMAFSLFLGGCDETPTEHEQSLETVSIPKLPYRFPKEDVEGLIQPNNGRSYVRLQPIGSDFILIFDSRREVWETRKGGLIVSGINQSLSDYNILNVGGLEVVCVDAPFFNCGTLIDDGEFQWSVLFSRDALPKADEVKRAAQSKLSAYRKGYDRPD